jgi:hypothetical protein
VLLFELGMFTASSLAGGLVQCGGWLIAARDRIASPIYLRLASQDFGLWGLFCDAIDCELDCERPFRQHLGACF